MNKDDCGLLKSRLYDMISLSEKNFMPVYSDFLDERQIFTVSSELSHICFRNFVFFGGYDNAQRKILCIHPAYFIPESQDFPLNIIQFSYRTSDILTHRDFLGAVMSCRIKREKIGDILVGDGIAQMMTYNSVSDCILNEIAKIGRVGVKVSIADKCTVETIQKYHDIKGTVASMRLDCILSLAVGKSREKTVQIIKKDGVDINFRTVFSPSAVINENDVFSVRGYGKFILREISGLSSKGRYHVLIQKFI
jgi:RNA-binding protein YlmH